MIQTTIYNRLVSSAGSFLGGGEFTDEFSDEFDNGDPRIYPTVGAPNSLSPYVTYDIQETGRIGSLSGFTGTTEYSVMFDIYSIQDATGLTIASAIKNNFDFWAGSPVKLSTLQDETQPPVSNNQGFQITQTFQVHSED